MIIWQCPAEGSVTRTRMNTSAAWRELAKLNVMSSTLIRPELMRSLTLGVRRTTEAIQAQHARAVLETAIIRAEAVRRSCTMRLYGRVMRLIPCARHARGSATKIRNTEATFLFVSLPIVRLF